MQTLEDPSSGLTYTALIGVKIQSVADVERLFGARVIEFMEKHGYKAEAEYVMIVRNWRRAIKRGLTEEQRRQFRDFLLEWTPWQKEFNDFSQLEVNR